MNGRIKAIRPDCGFGFVTGEDGVDRFFHQSALPDGVALESVLYVFVKFDPVQAPKGPRAINVRPVIDGDQPTSPARE